MARTNKTTEPEAPTSAVCKCGCGESVERSFKQGHDQRLISKLASDLVHGDVWGGTAAGILKEKEVRTDIQARINKVRDYMAAKLSEPLALKFENAAHRAWELEKTRD